MAILNIEPKTSKVTGGVIIDIQGNGFAQTPFGLAPLTSNVIDTSTSQSGLHDSTNGLILRVPEEINQRASFRIDAIFPEAFKIKIAFNLQPLSMPIIKNSNLIGIELADANNPSRKVRYFVSYSEIKGYQLILEEKIGTTTIYRKEELVNPSSILEIGIDVCGKYAHGLIRTSNHDSYSLSSDVLTATAYTVEIFTETPSSGVPMNSEVLIKRISAYNSVSFAGYPTNISSFSDTNIRTRTQAGELSIGDLIVAMSNLTIFKDQGSVKYTLSAHAGSVRKIFDTVQAIYGEHVSPSREDLFRNQEGFQWDENYILTEDAKNKELAVPSLWDPTTGNIPKDFFQSGVGPYNALRIDGIEKYTAEDIEKWYAKVHHGTYYIQNVPYYLFSDESVIEYLAEEKTVDGRSKHNLLFRPKIGIPVSVFSLTEDKETKITLQKKRLSKKGSFTGKVINGTELDTLDPANIDSSKEEFIVKINNNNEVKNWIIPIPENPSSGLYNFTLPKVPLREFKTIFSRSDIFKSEKTKASKYGEAIYSTFLYGEGIEDFGDYTIDYQTGEVQVKLEYVYKDFGVASFVYDYPAVIEFNKDFALDRGSQLIDPTYSDLSILDHVGTSNGRSFQEFRLTDFPVVDRSTYELVDNENIKIFTYDQFDNQFDNEWIRVINVADHGPADKVYQLDYANGLIRFGNNITGKIPGKYLDIYAGCKPTMQIQFEPESSNDYWIAKTTDMNLTKQNLSNGFLYLNRKRLVPSQIVAEFASKRITVFETTEISAKVYTQDGEIIPGIKVNFELLNGGGKFRDQDLLTNPNGYVSTIYTPSSRLEDMGIKVELFTPGLAPGSKGNPISAAYGSKNGVPFLSLKTAEIINGNLDDIVIFKILDDGDDFLPYNNITRKGGRLVLWYNSTPIPAPVRGEYLAGSIIGFGQQIPQSFDPYAPNYEPNLRGFYVVGKKTVQARAFVELDENRVYSNIVSLITEYSPIQKGVWKLPTPPMDYESSQINTATYIDINV